MRVVDRDLAVTRMAYAEVLPGFRPESIGVYVIGQRRIVTAPPAASEDVVFRARVLGWMAAEGPEHMFLCRDHYGINRPDLWDACAKVPVRDALIGRTCGVPACTEAAS